MITIFLFCSGLNAQVWTVLQRLLGFIVNAQFTVKILISSELHIQGCYSYMYIHTYLQFAFNDITFFHLVNCGNPTSPGSGYLEAYENTTEGAMIFFRCEPGFNPAGRMRAVCGSDGRWIPNPAEVRCTGEQLVGGDWREGGGGGGGGGHSFKAQPTHLPTYLLPSSLLPTQPIAVSFIAAAHIHVIKSPTRTTAVNSKAVDYQALTCCSCHNISPHNYFF